MYAMESHLLASQSRRTRRPAQPAFAPIEGPRPVAMALLCSLGFFHCALMVIGLLIAANDGPVFLVGMATVIAYAACLSGLWRMRAWSLPAYVAFMVGLHGLAALGGGFSPLALVLAAATVVGGLKNLDDMR